MSELATPTECLTGLTMPIRQDDVIQKTNNEPPKRAHFRFYTGEEPFRKLTTPTDELTGLPLPVLPPSEVPPINDKEFANWHHHYHPESSKLLKGVSGLAVRHVRLQLLPIVTHHNLYHSIFEGPPLPKSNEERFGQVVLACAGYIPPRAIDLYKDDPTESVRLSKSIRRRLQTSGEIALHGESNIGTFIKNHLVRQDFSHVNEKIIEEFVETRNVDRKWYLGHLLLAIASEIAVEPVVPIYRQALDEGFITSTDKKLHNLVKAKINGRKTSERAVKSLHKRLRRGHSLQTGVDAVQFTG